MKKKKTITLTPAGTQKVAMVSRWMTWSKVQVGQVFVSLARDLVSFELGKLLKSS